MIQLSDQSPYVLHSVSAKVTMSWKIKLTHKSILNKSILWHCLGTIKNSLHIFSILFSIQVHIQLVHGETSQLQMNLLTIYKQCNIAISYISTVKHKILPKHFCQPHSCFCEFSINYCMIEYVLRYKNNIFSD